MLDFRTVEERDFEFIQKILSDATLMQYFWHERPLTPEESRSWFDEWLEQQDRLGFSTWIVSEKSTEIPVGFIGLGPLTAMPEKMESFRIFLKEHWNKGYGQLSGDFIYHQGFVEFGLEQIYSSICPANRFSIRVAEKIGMRLVQYFPETNRNLYVMTKDEFLNKDASKAPLEC